MKIFVYGYPRAIGGADTELWHVLRLWKRFKVRVHLITAHRPAVEWRNQCDQLEFQTSRIGGPGWWESVPGLAGATVVSFCNTDFLRYAPILRAQDCKLVWANCMTSNVPEELSLCEAIGPMDAYVFQSAYQQSQLYPALQLAGVEASRCHRIPGALELADYPFEPLAHPEGSPFVIGRLARDDPNKWHARTWDIFGSVSYRPLKARIMGWGKDIAQKLGQPPAWGEVLRPCQETSLDFYRSLHALVSINGGARENWPRIGLEAMAAGVPIVVDNAWGWREMVSHGETGLLASDDLEFSYFTDQLARNECLRQSIARRARARLEDELACPIRIWRAWESLFESVSRAPRTAC